MGLDTSHGAWHEVQSPTVPFRGDKEQFKYFSSKVKAEEYVIINRPVLSIQDLLDKWPIAFDAISNLRYDKDKLVFTIPFGEVKQLAKSKIDKQQ